MVHEQNKFVDQSMLHRILAADTQSLQMTATTKKTQVHNKNCEICKLYAGIITNLWRAIEVFNRNGTLTEKYEKLFRPYKVAWNELMNNGFKVVDCAGKHYASGYLVDVLSYESTSECPDGHIVRMIKPQITYKTQVIQKAQVVVAMSQAKGTQSPKPLSFQPMGKEMCSGNYDELLKQLSVIITLLWHVKNKQDNMSFDSEDEGFHKIKRHCDASWDMLLNNGFEICDHTNESYPEGSSLKVIAFQAMPGYGSLTVAETIKPTIYFKNKKVQEGEVIVATPVRDDNTGSNRD